MSEQFAVCLRIPKWVARSRASAGPIDIHQAPLQTYAPAAREVHKQIVSALTALLLSSIWQSAVQNSRPTIFGGSAGTWKVRGT